MKKKTADLMLIDSSQSSNLRIATVDRDGLLQELLLDNSEQSSLRGSVYLGTVVRIEHSLQCAFVDYGGDRNGFLPFSEIHLDYYNIPVFDKQELLKKMRKERDPGMRVSDDGEDGEDDTASHDSFGKRPGIHKKYNIQEVIKRGQNVLVQVYKDTRGSKGVSLTTFISLASRYCVLMPNSNHGSVALSRKISDSAQRRKILAIAKEFPIGDGMSVVVRTSAVNALSDDLKRDFAYVANLWNDIREKTLKSKVGSLIYSDSDPVRQAVRDHFVDSMKKVVVEGSAYGDVIAAFEGFIPSEKKRVVHYKGKKPLFAKYCIESQIDSLLGERADLPSGGYLIINQTEALVTIDVNSGRATKEDNVESMALHTNLEAATEIARQLRLRELGGLVVIDFIDMSSINNRKEVEHVLSDAFSTDRAKIQMTRISMFGLLECSRQRIRPSLIEIATLPCGSCCGMGRVKSSDFVVGAILRSLQSCVGNVKSGFIQIGCSAQVMQSLRAKESDSLIHAFVKQNNCKVDFVEEVDSAVDAFVIREKVTSARGVTYKVVDENKGCAAHIIAKDIKHKPRRISFSISRFIKSNRPSGDRFSGRPSGDRFGGRPSGDRFGGDRRMGRARYGKFKVRGRDTNKKSGAVKRFLGKLFG